MQGAISAAVVEDGLRVVIKEGAEGVVAKGLPLQTTSGFDLMEEEMVEFFKRRHRDTTGGDVEGLGGGIEGGAVSEMVDDVSGPEGDSVHVGVAVGGAEGMASKGVAGDRGGEEVEPVGADGGGVGFPPEPVFGGGKVGGGNVASDGLPSVVLGTGPRGVTLPILVEEGRQGGEEGGGGSLHHLLQGSARGSSKEEGVVLLPRQGVAGLESQHPQMDILPGSVKDDKGFGH